MARRLALRVAVLTCSCLTCTIASRPAFRLDDDSQLSGRLSVLSDASHGSQDHAARGAEPLLLPWSCDETGVIHLEAGAVYRTHEDHVHMIAASCRELRGAEGALIEVSGSGIGFLGAAQISGPIVVTMAPFVRSMWRSAVRSSHNITVSSETGPVEFKDIEGLARGASISSRARIELSGSNAIKFSNVTTALDAGALYADNIGVFADDVTFLHTQGRNGGAIVANKVLLNTDGKISFETSSATKLGGGAVVARRVFKINGKGLFEFTNCRSSSRGGALLIKGDATFDLQFPGAVRFQGCISDEGGAIASNKNIYLVSGNFSFAKCFARRGNAIAAPYGFASISEGVTATYSQEDGQIGEAVLAHTAIIPVGGPFLEDDVVALSNKILASKGRTPKNFDCPAGARFAVDTHGQVMPDKCIFCPSGTISLAPTRAEVPSRVEKMTSSISLKIVTSGSLNEVHVPEQLAAEYRRARSCMKDPNATGCRHLHTAMVSQPLTFREFPGWSVAPKDINRKFCKGLYPSNKATCEDGLAVFPRWEALRFTNITPLPNATYDGERFRFDNLGHISVPFMQMTDDAALYLLNYSRPQPFENASQSTLFDIDDDGSVHPAWDHSLSLGVRRGPMPHFNNSCKVCHELSSNGAVRCLGGTHFTVNRGFMLQHVPGEHGVNVSRCPNRQACPFGRFSLTAEGHPRIRDAICDVGYNETKWGCAQCSRGFGRMQYDPFKCERCKAAGTLQRVLVSLSTSAFLYGMALRSANCAKKTKAQLILKIFLSFSTIASRCVSAIPYARDYQKMQEMDFVALLRSLMAGVGYALEEGAGGDHLSVDCLGLSEGQVSLALGMAVDFSVPVVLLAQVLGISAACLALVALLIVEWPFISPTVSLMILLLLVVLMLGTCFYLLAAFASAYAEEEARTFRLPWPVSFVLHRGQEAGLYQLPSSVTAILHEGCGGPPPEKDEEAEASSASGKAEGPEVAAPQEEEQRERREEPPGGIPGGGEAAQEERSQ